MMPDTIGNQLPQPDPRGWLVFDAPLSDELQRAEDATQHHDFCNGGDAAWHTGRDPVTGCWIDYFDRPATDTERTLLAHLGYGVPDTLTTRVSFPSR
jgi:hypothetical protein